MPSSARRKTLTTATRLALRQERSVPVLAKIKTWLDAEGEIVLPRSPMAAAITYAKNQWAALTRLRDAGLPEHRQQRRRAGPEAGGHRPKELALRRPRRRRRESCPALVADRFGPAARHRSAALSHQRPGQAALHPAERARRPGAIPARRVEPRRRGRAAARLTATWVSRNGHAAV